MSEISEAEKYFLLEIELKPYIKMMSEAGDIIINSEVSKYPIFVVHQQEIEIGIPIAIKEKLKTNWSINATTLEELVGKQLVKPHKVDNFRKNFKSTETYICLFVLSEIGAKFIFIKK